MVGRNRPKEMKAIVKTLSKPTTGPGEVAPADQKKLLNPSNDGMSP